MDHLTELAERLGKVLLAQGEQVSCAESCTGGGIAEAITRVAGSSAWFEAGFVTYSNRQKTAQLGCRKRCLPSMVPSARRWSRPWRVVPNGAVGRAMRWRSAASPGRVAVRRKAGGHGMAGLG